MSERTLANTARDARVVPHRLQVRGANVTAVRERIERRLGVETTARPEGHVWAVYFDAPAGVDVDFLRPDVLPPRVSDAVCPSALPKGLQVQSRVGGGK